MPLAWRLALPAAAAVGQVDRPVDLAALLAFRHYGKGRGHPARLNMGDGFAYAVARTHGSTLLFKGEDFGQTDIRAATDVR